MNPLSHIIPPDFKILKGKFQIKGIPSSLSLHFHTDKIRVQKFAKNREKRVCQKTSFQNKLLSFLKSLPEKEVLSNIDDILFITLYVLI